MSNLGDIGKPDFRELPQVLTQCGRAVVREITRCVLERQQPDGSPQRQNAQSTIERKKHDHPVIEKRARFTKESTFKVTPVSDSSVMITIASAEDSEIASHLDDMGYEFFGITDAASEEAYRIFDRYLENVVSRAFGGR